MPQTMDEMYGDGSSHEVCDICGCCVTCGDCKLFHDMIVTKRMDKVVKCDTLGVYLARR